MPVTPDVILTLCADAAGETCPVAWGGQLVRSHWGLPDPAKVEGDEATVTAAFTGTLEVLRARISALVEHVKREPQMDPARLQQLLDELATR